MESPVACRINKIKISTSYDTSKCSLAVKVGNDTFNSTSTTGEFIPPQSDYVWDASSTISITYNFGGLISADSVSEVKKDVL